MGSGEATLAAMSADAACIADLDDENGDRYQKALTDAKNAKQGVGTYVGEFRFGLWWIVHYVWVRFGQRIEVTDSNSNRVISARGHENENQNKIDLGNSTLPKATLFVPFRFLLFINREENKINAYLTSFILFEWLPAAQLLLLFCSGHI